MNCAEDNCPNEAVDDDFLCRQHRLAQLPWHKRPMSATKLKTTKPKEEKVDTLRSKAMENVKQNFQSPVALVLFFTTIWLIGFTALSFVLALWLGWKLAVVGLVLLILTIVSGVFTMVIEDEFK